ncbi:flavodoxin domain-containing protein [Bacillus sp. 1P06AnD]|uniref:flavodoxin domain-containing protein n=1 Tax=Bacillus sp. 1P06AnD TaxID=3132208 RepID=UPI0039A0174B
MSCFIVYATKYGSTERCAEYLQQQIPDSKIANLENTDPSLTDMDTIIIGTPIRFGQIHKAVRQFITQHERALMNRNVLLFLCCGVEKQAEQYFQANFPKELSGHALVKAVMGGELPMQNATRFDSFILRMVQKKMFNEAETPPSIHFDQLDELARIACRV